MADGWQILLVVLGGLLLAYVVLLGLLLIVRPAGVDLREAARLLPDTARLVGRLARDPEVRLGLRLRLWLLLGYLVCPLDLVPDFLPVLGWADDVILVLWVLRSVVRGAGSAVLGRHWTGSPIGLATLQRVVGATP